MSYPRARLTLTLICFHFSHCPTIITIFYRNGTPFTNIKHIFILAKVTNGLLRLTDRFFDLISNSPVTMQISGDKPNHICKLVCLFFFSFSFFDERISQLPLHCILYVRYFEIRTFFLQSTRVESE